MPGDRNHVSSATGRPTVRVSRIFGLSWAVALGCSTTIGLGVYALLGEYIALASRSTPLVYLLSILFAIPFILTFWERAVSLPGGGGAYLLSRSSGILWHRFFSGWLLLAGHVSVIVLLAWGLGRYVEVFIIYFDLLITPDDWLMTLVGLLMIMIYTAASRRVEWRQRMIYVMVGIGFLALVVVIGIFNSSADSLAYVYPAPETSLFGAIAMMMSGLWGLHLVLSVRERLQNPTQNMIWALSLPPVLAGVLGAGAAMAVGITGMRLTFPSLPLLDVIASDEWLSDGISGLLYIALAGGMTLLAANSTVIAMNRLMEAMTKDGFLPHRTYDVINASGLSSLAIWIVIVLLLSLVALLPVQLLMAVSAAFFLWSAAVLHAPDIFRAKPSLPPKRRIQLPFHPLFPGLSVAVGILTSAVLPWRALVCSGVWVLLGAGYYWWFARSRGHASRRELTVIDEAADIERLVDALDAGSAPAHQNADLFTVLVGVSKYETATYRLRLAAKMAAARGGQVLVLKIVDLPDYSNQVAWQRVAHREWQSLTDQIAEVNYDDVPLKPIVRLSSSYSEGILQTVIEEQADWLLVGWSPDGGSDGRGAATRTLLGQLISYAECNVGILRGAPVDDLDQLVVAAAGGKNAVTGLQVAGAAASAETKLHLVHVIQGVSAAAMTEEAEAVLAGITDAASMADDERVNAAIINAPTISGGIAARYKEADMLIVGASRHDLPERSYYGGLGQDLMERDSRPTLLVRSMERSSLLSARRIVERFADLLPALTAERRSEVVRQMRSSALPTVDFFVLIVLSSIIATLGLLQNSAAVIIGAMLVAPLMSPILSIGMGMTMGEPRTMQNGLESTLKGMVLAIVVGAVMVIISPIDAPTSEILARTSPNILDLMVALASGAAAGYAISRKEVAAALPGVAIAAALVPPLCVVGYGIGVSQLDISAGALLLFTTNLIAIIFAAAVTFMGLGFHPPRGDRGQLIRTMRITILSLIVVSAVLLVATVTTVRQEQIRRDVDATFEELINERAARVVERTVTRDRNGHTITATVINFPQGQLDPEAFTVLENALEEAVGTPVKMDITVVDGWQDDMVNIDERIALVNLLEERVAENGAEVQESSAAYSHGRYVLGVTILVYDGHTLDGDVLSALNQEMSELVEAPVSLEATFLEAFQGALVSSTPVP